MRFKPRIVVSVRVLGFIDHVGIATDIGTVVSASKIHGGVIEQDFSAFSGGRQMRPVGYLGDLPTAVVIAKARSMIGERWDLFEGNCEHFVHWAHGLEPRSPQIRRGLTLLLVATFAALAIRAS